MQDYREVGQSLFNLFKNIKAELGVGTGLKLISAVLGADSNCERVAAGALNKFLYIFRPCVG